MENTAAPGQLLAIVPSVPRGMKMVDSPTPVYFTQLLWAAVYLLYPVCPIGPVYLQEPGQSLTLISKHLRSTCTLSNHGLPPNTETYRHVTLMNKSRKVSSTHCLPSYATMAKLFQSLF